MQRILMMLVFATGLMYASAAAADCPANSHAVASSNGTVTCVCNDGYVWNGGQCVPR